MTFRKMFFLCNLFFLFISQVEAHYCESPIPCRKFWEATAVFTGTVKKAVTHKTKDYSYHTVIVEIEQAFRGDIKKGQQFELIDSSEYRRSGHFELNKKYFIYAIGSYAEPGRYAGIQVCTKDRPCVDKKPDKYYAGLSICSATKPLERATDDLEYAKQVQQNKAGKIFGRVINKGFTGGKVRRSVNSMVREQLRRQEMKESLIESKDPSENKTIIATDEQGKTYQTQSKKGGWFSLNQLPASSYTVSLKLNKEFHLSADYKVKLEENRCADMDLPIYSSRLAQIKGKLLDENKRPKTKETLYLVPVDKVESLDNANLNGFEASYTGKNGEFWFPATPAGKYYLTMNPRGAVERDPYPKTYYSGVIDIKKAKIVEVKEGQQLTLNNFQLKSIADNIATIQGTVKWSNGKVAAKSNIWSYPFKDGKSTYSSNTDRTVTDNNGAFLLRCFEGKEYELNIQYIDEKTASKVIKKSFICNNQTVKGLVLDEVIE